ncbi:MAG: SMI1/KNR4 family protein, partial [Gemmataceae bacterium]
NSPARSSGKSKWMGNAWRSRWRPRASRFVRWSRRPPETLNWGAILCATVGLKTEHCEPTADELRQALELLKGATKAPAKKAEKEKASEPTLFTDAPAPTGLAGVLRRLDVWLAKNRPGFHQALLPGASPAELDALRTVLGGNLSEDLSTLLSWHNGQGDDFSGCFYESFNLMNTAQIAASWQDRHARGDKDWNSAWIPFLDDYQDDLLVVDPTTNKCGVREVWRGRTDHPIIADSLASWLEGFVKDVEAQRFVEDPERGEFMRVSGR